MRTIQGVSYPRSGHGLLVRLLARYFSEDPGFEIRDNSVVIAGRFGYCEYYGHCRHVPCTDPRVTFQKNHDFDLRLPYRSDGYYLVQYRDPVPAIISAYERALARGELPKSSDSESCFRAFFRIRLAFHAMFKKKWVDGGARSNVLLVRYEELVKYSRDTVAAAVRFCDPGNEVDESLLTEVVDNSQIAFRRNVDDFRYFTKDLESVPAHAWDCLRYYAWRKRENLTSCFKRVFARPLCRLFRSSRKDLG